MNKKKFTRFLKHFKINKETTGGRSRFGNIITRHKGSGLKNLHIAYNKGRLSSLYSEFVVLRIFYDANRSGKLALIGNNQGICQIILAPEGVTIGSILYYSNTFFSRTMLFAPGTNSPLSNIPTGSRIFNIENRPGEGGVYARSAGCYAKLLIKKMFRYKQLAGIQLPSKKIIYVPGECHAFLGRVSNAKHKFSVLRKAGKNRNAGIRPTVRGIAMNPIDHPHGGGEGKSATPVLPKTPWGKPAKWKKTINKLKIKKYKVFISRINRLGLAIKKNK